MTELEISLAMREMLDCSKAPRSDVPFVDCGDMKIVAEIEPFREPTGKSGLELSRVRSI